MRKEDLDENSFVRFFKVNGFSGKYLAFYEYDYSQEGKRKAQSLKDKRKNLEIKLGIQTKNESSRNLKKIYSGTNKRI